MIVCISSSVSAIVTSSLPATSISAVGSYAFDQNATITATALVPNPNYQYSLDYGALQFSNVFTNVTNGTSPIEIKVKATNSITSCSAIDSINILPIQPPTLNMAVSKPQLCRGSQTYITLSSTSTPPVSTTVKECPNQSD